MAAEAGEFGTAWAAAEDEAVAGMRARARTARALRAAEARGEKLSARRRAAQEAQDAKGRALQQNEGEELSFPDEAPTDLVAYPVNRTTLVQAVGTKGSGLLRRWQVSRHSVWAWAVGSEWPSRWRRRQDMGGLASMPHV